LALAEILAGWATAVEGNTTEGLVQLRHGLDSLKSTGAELRLPFYHGLLAEVCGLAGQLDEALANIANGFAFLSKNGELWAAPELHRIHGDLLLLSGDASQSEISYRLAIESAQQTGARLFELRAAACLCKPPALRKDRKNTAER
jgi:predicted ATPase